MNILEALKERGEASVHATIHCAINDALRKYGFDEGLDGETGMHAASAALAVIKAVERAKLRTLDAGDVLGARYRERVKATEIQGREPTKPYVPLKLRTDI